MTLAKPALTTLSALALSAVVVTGVTQLADASSGTSGSTSTADRADGADRADRAHAGRVPGGPVVRRWYADLDAADRTCLAKHQVTTHPGPGDVTSRLAVLQQVRSAAADCDVAFPQAARLEKRLLLWQDLSADQRACLAKVDLTRPIGPLTKEQRQARRQTLRSAASACDVTLPGRTG